MAPGRIWHRVLHEEDANDTDTSSHVDGYGIFPHILTNERLLLSLTMMTRVPFPFFITGFGQKRAEGCRRLLVPIGPGIAREPSQDHTDSHLISTIHLSGADQNWVEIKASKSASYYSLRLRKVVDPPTISNRSTCTRTYI